MKLSEGLMVIRIQCFMRRKFALKRVRMAREAREKKEGEKVLKRRYK
jgi:hypothetical protein